MAVMLLPRLFMPLAGPIKGDIVLSFPLTAEKLENIYIDARLYEYDPFLADASATLLDQVELEGINLSATADSLVDIYFSATRKTRMMYYVTARTYSKKRRHTLFLHRWVPKNLRATGYRKYKHHHGVKVKNKKTGG